jgi:hypothetical protein
VIGGAAAATLVTRRRLAVAMARVPGGSDGRTRRAAPFPIADPVRLEKRRANLGLEPFAENELRVRQLAADPNSPGVNT